MTRRRRARARGTGQVRGERHGGAKLTDAIVVTLRASARDTSARAGFVQRAAKRYGVQVCTIANAIHGTTWAHVPKPVKQALVITGARAQKAVCKAGHPLSGDNLRKYRDKRGYLRRICVTCSSAHFRAWQQRHP